MVDQWSLPSNILLNLVVAANIIEITLLMSPLQDKHFWVHSRDGNLSAKKEF
jgi:hypothetical protein